MSTDKEIIDAFQQEFKRHYSVKRRILLWDRILSFSMAFIFIILFWAAVIGTLFY